MRLRHLLTTGAVLPLLAFGCGDDDDPAETSTSTAAPVEVHPEPEYAYEGADGPENWGEIDPEWAECTDGEHQSPVDLQQPASSDADRLEIDYRPDDPIVLNNGHTVEVDVDDAGSVTVDGKEYSLEQFHFHAPSEHALDGESFPAEFHFVNQAEDESLAVVSVLAEEGGENAAFAELLDELPPAEGDEFELDGDIDIPALLGPAAKGSHWSYQGSLTTPPCSQGVTWNVLDEQIELSERQIEELLAVHGENNRPRQPLNGRSLALSD